MLLFFYFNDCEANFAVHDEKITSVSQYFSLQFSYCIVSILFLVSSYCIVKRSGTAQRDRYVSNLLKNNAFNRFYVIVCAH